MLYHIGVGGREQGRKSTVKQSMRKRRGKRRKRNINQITWGKSRIKMRRKKKVW